MKLFKNIWLYVFLTVVAIDLSAATAAQWNVLIAAINADNVKQVQKYVPKIIKPTETSKGGRTPYQMAQFGNRKKVVAYLQKYEKVAKKPKPLSPAAKKKQALKKKKQAAALAKQKAAAALAAKKKKAAAKKKAAQQKKKKIVAKKLKPGIDDTIYFYNANEPYYEFTNFYQDPVKPKALFVDNGKGWPSSEHYFQAQKFLTHHPDMAEKIRLLKTPREAFDYARDNAKKIDPMWHTGNPPFKEAAMRDALDLKFGGKIENWKSQNPRLTKLLLNTGNKRLVEASTKDDYWGTGMSEQEIKAAIKQTGHPRPWEILPNKNPQKKGKPRGENRLGILLEETREEIRNKSRII